jgi:hypothetical protein
VPDEFYNQDRLKLDNHKNEMLDIGVLIGKHNTQVHSELIVDMHEMEKSVLSDFLEYEYHGYL